ncbi:MAG: acyl carrier protein [Acidobacteria bacterium]|nr:acyl carrier protein [Acidobacteriota bacterium]
MNAEEIRAAVKRAISTTANMETAQIGDDASYKDDLQLDSLTILEIAVGLEYEFQIKIPDEQLSEIRSVGDTVRLIQQHLA